MPTKTSKATAPAVKTVIKKTAPAKKQEPLATKPTGTIVTKGVHIDAEADAGAGQENMKAQDLAIPQLILLQSGSPQVKKSDPAHIKGAEEGQICDPLSENLFDGEEGIAVVPVSYRRSHVEWKDREGGGGFVKDHGSDGRILDQCKPGKKDRPTLPNGNTISVVAEYFVFLLGDRGVFQPYVLRMASTQLTKARRWNTMINQLRVPGASGGTFNPAMFYSVFRLTTVPEQNDQGSWFGWKIVRESNTLDLPNGPEVYAAARDFRLQISQGAVKTHQPVDDGARGAAAAEDNDAPM